jgi:hypothetical protein
MKSFTIRWRSARQHREYELAAGEEVAAPLVAALEASGGMAVWQAGTLWKCPGCGDRTVKTEEFLEGMRRAERWLLNRRDARSRESAADDRFASFAPLREAIGNAGAHESAADDQAAPALTWLAEAEARMLGCERDRVYVKDESGGCAYENTTYTSRI